MKIHDIAKEFAAYYNEVNAQEIEDDKNNYRKRIKRQPMSIGRGADLFMDVINFLVKKINEEDRIYIADFGSFTHVKRAEKQVRHPATKQMTVIPERDEVVFRMSSNVKER